MEKPNRTTSNPLMQLNRSKSFPSLDADKEAPPLLGGLRAKTPLHRRSASDHLKYLLEMEIKTSLTLSDLQSFENLCISEEPKLDHKKLKRRMLAQWLATRNSRLNKHIRKLKKDIEVKETKISKIKSQVWNYEFVCSILEEENNKMKQKMEALASRQAYKEAEYEALKEHKDALMVLRKQQQEEKIY